MAEVRKCDACGTFFEPCLTHGGVEGTYICMNLYTVKNGDFIRRVDKRDLCVECFDRLMSFISSRKPKLTLE